MRKQIVIGLSMFALTAWGGANESELLLTQGANHNTAHLVETSLNQTFEPKSRASLSLDLPKRFSYQSAAVQFIAGKKSLAFTPPSFPSSFYSACRNIGYTKSSCSSGNPTNFCPYDNRYFKECCDSAYKYSKTECFYPLTISSTSCGGKFKCYCDTKLYPYTKSNCAAPKELADKCVDDSGEYYAECKCPSYYKPCSSNSNLIGVGTVCVQDGQSLYADCECKSGYVQVCEEFGPVNANDYCLNGIKYYKSCKTCGDYGYLTSCPVGVECSFEQCSGKYFPTGKCSSGYVDISDTSCEWYKYFMNCSTAPERS